MGQKYFRVREYVEGCYYYDLPLDETLVADVNRDFTNHYGTFNPITLEDLIRVANYDQTWERFDEENIYKIQWGDEEREHKEYLGEAIYEYLNESIWDMGAEFECHDTLDVERDVIEFD